MTAGHFCCLMSEHTATRVQRVLVSIVPPWASTQQWLGAVHISGACITVYSSVRLLGSCVWADPCPPPSFPYSNPVLLSPLLTSRWDAGPWMNETKMYIGFYVAR